MSDIKTFPSESGHFYDPTTGNQVDSIIGKNGKRRAPYVKEALALGYVPGVTSILGQMRKYGLEIYGKKQAAMSALTMPRLNGETDEDFIERILTESKEHSQLASERGTSLHGAIEKYIRGEAVPVQWSPHVVAVRHTLEQYGIDLALGKPEHTFTHPLGYGGKLDIWFDNPRTVLDIKSKDEVTNKKRLAYPDHCRQLVAYDCGVFKEQEPTARLVNVFVGADDGAVRIFEWVDREEIGREWKIFKHLLDIWRLIHE